MSTPPPPPPGLPGPFESGPFQPGQPASNWPSGSGPAGSLPGQQPPPPGFQTPPPGYQPFGQGMQPASQKNNGLAIASMVLSLVNIIPCFWFFPLPALLGTIFGVVSRNQIKRTGAKGAGMALAGLIVGIIFLVISIAIWIWFANNSDCYRDGTTYRCYSN